MKSDNLENLAIQEGNTHAIGAAPPPRARDWTERKDAPILDAALVPLKTYRENKPWYSAYGLFLWLRVVRPLLTIAFWVAVVAYTVRHFFRPTEQMDDYRLLAVYGAVIIGIFIIMLMLAPVRRGAQRNEEFASLARRSTPAELAAYAELSNQRLSRWKFTRRLIAHHDKQGRLRHASDLDSGLAAASPIGAIGIDTPIAGPRPPSEAGTA
jgi:poly-beta-1,6-N-acetyl-D-glucosamine biosynthesis protein PgaD